MNSLGFLVPLFFLLFWFLWFMRLSPMARSTRELSALNKLWEAFHSGVDPNEIDRQLALKNWKYHKPKVEILKSFTKERKVFKPETT